MVGDHQGMHRVNELAADLLRRGSPLRIKARGGSMTLFDHGVVPVAIMSTPTFDARTVDPITVTLANAAVKLKGNGKPNASFQDVNGDGRPDLVVHVETSALQLTSTDTVAVLKGRTFSGQRVKGSDSVRISLSDDMGPRPSVT